MKFLRWIACKMNIRHRIEELWCDLETSGLTRFSALLYGSMIRYGNGKEEVQYYKCRDCDTIMAPFEMKLRGWTPVAK